MGVFRYEEDVRRMLEDVGDSGKSDFGLMLRVGNENYTNIFNDVSSDLFNQYSTPVEAVEIHRNKYQNMLDQFFDK